MKVKDISDHQYPGVLPKSDTLSKSDLIPSFLSLKSLYKQHIDSFSHLLNHDLPLIILSKHNRRITSDIDPNFYLQYNAIRVISNL